MKTYLGNFYCIVVIITLFLQNIQSDVGTPLSLLSSVILHDYELNEKGNDSQVIKIHSLEQFKEVISSPNLVILRWYTSPTNQDGMRGILQKTAIDYKNKVHCFSVNLLESPAFSEYIFPLISKVLIKYKTVQREETAISKNLLTILSSLAQVQKGGSEIEPFVLFFQKGMLLINNFITFKEPKELYSLVDELISVKSVTVLS